MVASIMAAARRRDEEDKRKLPNLRAKVCHWCKVEFIRGLREPYIIMYRDYPYKACLQCLAGFVNKYGPAKQEVGYGTVCYWWLVGTKPLPIIKPKRDLVTLEDHWEDSSHTL
jgi:hypothetical protein